MKTAEEKAEDGYQYLLEQGTLNDLSAQKQIEIQEALRITSGKYANQPAVGEEDIKTILMGTRTGLSYKLYEPEAIKSAKAILSKLKGE